MNSRTSVRRGHATIAGGIKFLRNQKTRYLLPPKTIQTKGVDMAGLLDFIQGASNAAASNVSAPVDGIAWLLRKAGVPIPDAPMGGSDWMAQKGLTRPAEGMAGLLGETAGGLAPILAAAKAPQIAQGLLKAGDNLAAPRTLSPQTGAIVWHGSPHKFSKFDSSKIGTGEGAQAYGHGLYLAESKDVAGEYQKKLTDPAFKYAGMNDAKVRLNEKIAKRIEATDPARAAKLREEVASLSEPGGALYKVDLPDEHIAKMLDWDKPLSQQPKEVLDFARKALDKEISNAGKVADGWGDLSAPYDALSELTGQDLVYKLRPNLNMSLQNITGGGGPEVSNALRQAGIPGIRYLDGGSRGAGVGSSNFVVFPGNEDFLKILERNGQPMNGLLGN